eukprot:gene8752-6156_t
MTSIAEAKDSNKVFKDTIFMSNNKHISDQWVAIRDIYPEGGNEPLLPETLSTHQFGQGAHYECFMLSALSALMRFPDVIKRCFVTKKVRQDGRYTFQFFRGKSWIKVEIDDLIPMEDGEVLYIRSPTHHWWPLLLEKAYAKFYTAYDHLEGCTLLETFHDLTGNPVLNIPMEEKLAKIVGVDLTAGEYWNFIGKSIRKGDYVASLLTKDMELEQYGIQSDQQYTILDIFSLDDTNELSKVVVQLYNPFEDDQYCGPLCASDRTWTPELKNQYPVNDPHLIHLPFSNFIQWSNYVQLCFMNLVDNDATYFADEWRGPSAGGNPTYSTWRKNPLYLVRNSGETHMTMVVCLKQEDQRRFTELDECTKYLQCGVVMSSSTREDPIPTRWVTGNNHRAIHKSLFLNAREVTTVLVIPPKSVCYLVPSAMNKGTEAKFLLALYRFRHEDYSHLSLSKLSLPQIDWEHPATKTIEVKEKGNYRLDFSVDGPCEVHILLHQTKPYVSKSGGDTKTQDYMGMYLYDPRNERIDGVNAATNYREMSLVHQLPEGGRYALAITCPRSKGNVPALVSIVSSPSANVTIVSTPQGAKPLIDELESIEEEDHRDEVVSIDTPMRSSFTSDRRPGSSRQGKRRTKDTPPSSQKTSSGGSAKKPREEREELSAVDRAVEKVANGEPLTAEEAEALSHKDNLTAEEKQAAERAVEKVANGEPLTAEEAEALSHKDNLTAEEKQAIENASEREKEAAERAVEKVANGEPLTAEEAEALSHKDNLTAEEKQAIENASEREKEAAERAVEKVANGEPLTAEEAEALSHKDNLTAEEKQAIENASEREKRLLSEAEALSHKDNLTAEEKQAAERAVEKVANGEPLTAEEAEALSHKDNLTAEEKQAIENASERKEAAERAVEKVANGEPLTAEEAEALSHKDNLTAEEKQAIENASEREKEAAERAVEKAEALSHKDNLTAEEKQAIENASEREKEAAERAVEKVANGEPLTAEEAEALSHKDNLTGNEQQAIEDSREAEREALKRAKEKAAAGEPLTAEEAEALEAARREELFVEEGRKKQVECSEHRDEKKKLSTRENSERRTPFSPRSHHSLHSPEYRKDQMEELMKDPEANAAEIAALKQLMSEEEERYKKAKAQRDSYMDKEYEGRALRKLSLDSDEEFVTAEKTYVNKVASVLGDISASLEFTTLKATMNSRAQAVAHEMNVADREKYLPPNVLGIPTEQLQQPLSCDESFHNLEKQRAKLVSEDVIKKAEVHAVEEKLIERAKEVAEAVHTKERASLNQFPEGIPLYTLPLNEDEQFTSSEAAARNAREPPMTKAKEARLLRAEEQLNERAAELAMESRKEYLDAEPEGVPLKMLHLANNDDFLALEKQRREMLQSDEECEGEDSRGFLDPEPEGVKLKYLPLDMDNKFKDLENVLKSLKARNVEPAKIRAVEEQMNDRACELARKQKRDDLENMKDKYRGIPVELLEPHKDPKFNRMAERLRDLKKIPERNIDEISDTRDAMSDQLFVIAEAYLANDRAYLDPEPEGVPIRLLKFENDDLFKDKESKRAKLKMEDSRRNASSIRTLEEELNHRAHDLAKFHIVMELEGINHRPEELPLEILKPYEDSIFKSEVEKMRELGFYTMSKPEVVPIKEAMNKRLLDMARAKLQSDRDYLLKEPKGVPISMLPLSADVEFRSSEARRMVLKEENPRRNAEVIKELEDKLNNRLLELAERQLRRDMEGLSPEPEGIPLPYLNLHENADFKELVNVRRTSKDPEEVQRVVAEMNKLSHKVARELRLKNRHDILEPDPEGVPLALLPLDRDTTFCTMEVRCTCLMAQDPRRNAKSIKEHHDELNKRARELALDQKRRDLEGVEPMPLGVLLDLLKPHEDEKFSALVDEVREKKRTAATPQTEEDKASIAQTVQSMSARAVELAREVMDRGFLEPEPSGVPLEDLPLDNDPEFHSLELDRAMLKLKEGRRAVKKIEVLEGKLNDCAMRLAKNQCEQDIASVPPSVGGVPKDILNIHGDPRGAVLITSLRQLRKDPDANQDEIEKAEEELNEIAERLASKLRVLDRSYLNPRPLNIPLADLPLDTDENFKNMEGKRAALKSAKHINTSQLRSIETSLNDRAEELARLVMEEDLKPFKAEYEGFPTKSLRPHDNKGFSQAAEKVREQRRDESIPKDPTLRRVMEDILNEIALEKKYGDLYFLESYPEGLPIEEIEFGEDEKFQELVDKRNKLRGISPLEDREAILALEDQMNARATAIAKEILSKDLCDVEQNPLGIPLELLKPRKDPEVARLIPQLRRAKRTAYLQSRKNALVAQIDDRLNFLATNAINEGRQEYLDDEPEGVPIDTLPLDKDDAFTAWSVERAVLRLENPAAHEARIKELENQLNERAHQLAKSQLERDLQGIDENPEGVPLELLNPHSDPRFASLVVEDRLLKKDPIHNADKIRQHQEVKNNRVKELAQNLLKEHRSFLEPEPLGVPLAELPLETDPVFHALEVQRLTEKLSKNPNKESLVELEMQLSQRAEELAEQQLINDLAGIDPFPLGVPLQLLHPHKDEKFASFIPEVRRLNKDLSRNSAKLKALREKMDERAIEMAEEFLETDRESYLDIDPEGIPWRTLFLDKHHEFKDRENQKLLLQAESPLPKEEITNMETELNRIVHEIAINRLHQDRQYLDSCPEGVNIEVLPLDTDAIFHELETARSAAKSQRAFNQVADLEDQLNARAVELARVQKNEDLKDLDQNPRGIPLSTIRPHEDPEFSKMVNQLRHLKSIPEDSRDDAELRELQDQMNARALELCDVLLSQDRGYLKPKPNGIPIRYLGLDSDPVFQEKEAIRITLKLDDPKKNQAKVMELEEELNQRAYELAADIKDKDLEGLSQSSLGIPIKLINPHKDDKFAALMEEKRALSAEEIEAGHPVIDQLNKLVEQLTDAMLKGDRDYLDRDPEGVPLITLPLDDDETFHGMEVERAVLNATDPVRNAAMIVDLENQLNARAHDLARNVLVADRSYLNPRPEGVPLADLRLHQDNKFHQMEVDRAKLKARDTASNIARIRELEIRLNDRAVELAKKQLEEDLQGLDRSPEGYPLPYLNPHNDEQFALWIPELRSAKAAKNQAKVHEIQELLNDRAHAIARDRITHRLWKSSAKKSDAFIREAEKRMNKRAHELAKELLVTSRGFLDQEPEGIPIAEIQMDRDEQFKDLEIQRLHLLAADSVDPKIVAALEEQMNQRLHELAVEEKHTCRDFLSDYSHGVPKEFIQLDEDFEFVQQERELRRTIKSMGISSSAASLLRTDLQNLADKVAERQVKGDRKRYIHVKVDGVELGDIPLDSDPTYTDMEVERAILVAKDAVTNASKIVELEVKLNERANELLAQVIHHDRSYIPAEIHGIPIEELPLDSDDAFRTLEAQRRMHKRQNNRDAVLEDDDGLRKRAQELAEEVVAQDLSMLRDQYRSIPKSDLNLHSDSKFRELANKRRRRKGKGRMASHEVTQIEDEMDQRAADIANAMVEAERAFLDPEPEGMLLSDVPLDNDSNFHQLEAEYRRRLRHPHASKQEKVIKELQVELNQRAHTLARQEFSKRRTFLDPEPRGIPLTELGLDEDPEFKEAEIALYRHMKGTSLNKSINNELEERMRARSLELARVVLNEDRRFLDPEPEGVPLEELMLDIDDEFSDLARERRRRKRALKQNMGEEQVKAVEEKMNRRAHEIAKEFLNKERGFLMTDPEGIPLADVPLGNDPEFHRLEKQRLQLKHEQGNDKFYKIQSVEEALKQRASEVAREMHKKERGFLEQEPLGVPLEELPLNYDDTLNPMEAERRALRKEPKRYIEEIRALEDQIADRVFEIAHTFVNQERSFMDPEPAGVPLRYLPLNTDPEFHALEIERRRLKRNNAPAEAIWKIEKKMDSRARGLAKELVEKGRGFLDPEPLGVPIADVPLNGDEQFRHLEEQRRAVKQENKNAAQLKALEQKLNERASQLAAQLLESERSFMDQCPGGIPLQYLPLNEDHKTREVERARRRLRKENPENTEAIKALEKQMETRALELAHQQLAGDRGFLDPEPCGVPLKDLHLDKDPVFHKMEVERHNLKRRHRHNDGIARLEDLLNDRAYELAHAIVDNERFYLDQEPEGIPLARLPLDKDPEFHAMELERRELLTGGRRNTEVDDLEERMNIRVRELALAIRGWQDKDFHDLNQGVAEEWPRICELFPEGRSSRIEPSHIGGPDVASAPGDLGYLVPFIAALSRHPILLQRLIVTTEHPINGPYTFVFFDPNSNPVYVDIDDRVPCTAQLNPKFIISTRRLWYPLLLEKAYAKFVGGYAQMDNCTPHETLRDLTGRPVTHIPFDRKLAAAANCGDYNTLDFWRGIAEDMNRGDIIICMSRAGEGLDGIHPQCSYALFAVVETVEGTSDPSDVVLKLHNAYRGYPPEYSGPLGHDDLNWNEDLRRVCKYETSRDDILYIPLPTFLRNFSSMQRCHINCGDRLTAVGVWDKITAGGNPKFTSFRTNPIFLVENKSTRPATILTEVRHTCAQFVDPEGLNHYPQTGVLLMQPLQPSAPPTPLITNSTHKFLQKGMMLDSREVCSVMELPPSSTCYIVPYTMKRGQIGSFNLSIYPGMAKVVLTPLQNAGLAKEPLTTKVVLSPGDEGKRVDLYLSEAAQVHVLLHQDKVTDQRFVAKGDVIAEDDVTMLAFNEDGVKVASSGEPTNAREHSLVFQTKGSGRFALFMVSPNQVVSGDCPCTISVFVTKGVQAKFVPSPTNARPLMLGPKVPTLPKTAPGVRKAQQQQGSHRPNTGDRPVMAVSATSSLQTTL